MLPLSTSMYGYCQLPVYAVVVTVEMTSLIDDLCELIKDTNKAIMNCVCIVHEGHCFVLVARARVFVMSLPWSGYVSGYRLLCCLSQQLNKQNQLLGSNC